MKAVKGAKKRSKKGTEGKAEANRKGNVCSCCSVIREQGAQLPTPRERICTDPLMRSGWPISSGTH